MFLENQNSDTQPKQNTSEWHEFRSKHVGASEVPAIMGTCDFKNIYQLWLLKCKLIEPQEQNFAMRRGIEHESTIRKLYSEKTGFEVVDKVLEYPDWNTLSASLDGWVESEKLVVEIKYPSKAKHQQALVGVVPETYRDQLQTQMLVSGANHADYVSFNPDENDEFKLAIVRVKSDKARQQEILEKAKFFWACVQTKTPPIEIAEQPELFETLKIRASIQQQIKDLEKSLEEFTNKIKSQMKADTVKCENFTISFSDRKGNVDYSKIPELEKIDLEKYRKPSTRLFLVKENKKDSTFI